MNLATDPYADILDLLVTPRAEEVGGADPPTHFTAAPVFQECTDCNGLDTNFLDQFTDLDTILNMDMSQQIHCQDGDVFLPDVTTPSSPSSSSSIGAVTSDLATPTCLYSPLDSSTTFTLCMEGVVYEQGLMALLCADVSDAVTTATPLTSTTPPTTPLSIASTPSSSTSPLSLLYHALSPNKDQLQDDAGSRTSQDGTPPSAKRARSNAPSAAGLGKRGPRYTERRQKNNEASKVSRKRRKERCEEMALREEKLKEENARLRRQVEEMMNETSVLKALLVSRLASQRAV